jgi:phosphatidylinositol glycan class B
VTSPLVSRSFVRGHLLASLVVIVVTAIFSYAYFHIDEYYQVLEWTWFKLGLTDERTLPWEYGAKLRPWMQPFVYWAIARALGLRDVFQGAFVFRLVTGIASWGAIALFLRTTLPWFASEREQRLHVRVVTLAGFVPYLAVRTSSETLAMAAFTAAFAIVLGGATRGERGWTVSHSGGASGASGRVVTRLVVGGALCGVAFEVRFQSALLALGLFAWLAFVARAGVRALAILALSALATLALGAIVDRWGYGEWTFPAWSYLRANLFEGAAAAFGSEVPFAYAWLLPSNVFLPVVIAFLLLGVVAWLRNPRHPVTWATVPFFVVHNLLAHKEERFLFPLAILATAFVAMALGGSAERPRRLERLVAWIAARRAAGWALAAWSTAMMTLLALYPLGWHHHVRFTRHVHDALGGDLEANALLDFDTGLPAYHGRVYAIEKAPPDELARRIDEGTARAWLVTDSPHLATGTPLDDRATLVFTEVPFAGTSPALAALVERVAAAYDDRVRPPLRPVRFRSLYRLHSPPRPER